MRSNESNSRIRRTLGLPVAAALGAVGASMLMHGTQAVSQTPAPPIQPSPQVLSMQDAFEQVADKLRPSVVYIKSQTKVAAPAMLRRSADGQDDGQDGGSPFSFNFPGFPGMGGQGGQGGQRSFPRFQMPMGPRSAEASGSGVIVRGDGYILTNDHVVEGASKVTVRLQDGREFIGKVFQDHSSDLAVIKIDANNLPAAQLADSDSVRIGQWAIAFGSPFRLTDTMTVGVVSSVKREQSIGGGSDGRLYPSLIQTDASINPGNSGGPLVDVYGRVVGINVAIESPSGGSVGIGFAIPANTARYVVDQLIRTGSVTRGYLGLVPEALDYATQKQYGVTNGALVRLVQDDTPAAHAGLAVGDVITRFGDKAVLSDGDLRDMISRTRPNTSVPVVVHRDGHDVSLNVTVGAVPASKVVTSANNDTNSPDMPAPAQQGKIGVAVGNADNASVRQQLGLKGAPTPGAVVVEVAPGSPAQSAGLQPGDVITRLNGRPIANAEALTETARGLKEGQRVAAIVRRGSQTMLVQLDIE